MSMPEMIPVDSSNIQAVGFDEVERVLYVQFLHSGTYVYSDVSAETYQEMMQADSKGSYFNREIRSNFEYHQL